MGLSKNKRKIIREYTEQAIRAKAEKKESKKTRLEQFKAEEEQLRKSNLTEEQKVINVFLELKTSLEGQNGWYGKIILTLHEIDTIKEFYFLVKKRFPILARSLTTPSNHLHLCWRIIILKGYWIRPLSEWKPAGKSIDSKIYSLVEWLFFKYKTPSFMITALTNNSDIFIKLFIHLSQGHSMKEANAQGLLCGAIMTHKMNHLFLNAPSKITVIQAIRYAQVLGFGGSKNLAKSIYTSSLGLYLELENSFIKLIEWFCKQVMFDHKHIQVIIDWYRAHLHIPNFSLKGRTVISILKDARQWHEDLKRAKLKKYYVYPPSGFSGYSNDPEKPEDDLWQIIELKNSKELRDEGAEQHHCVYSYEQSILDGVISIWSMKLNGKRKLTIEVRNRSRQIVQARGKFNEKMSESENFRLTLWAKMNNLDIWAT